MPPSPRTLSRLTSRSSPMSVGRLTSSPYSLVSLFPQFAFLNFSRPSASLMTMSNFTPGLSARLRNHPIFPVGDRNFCDVFPSDGTKRSGGVSVEEIIFDIATFQEVYRGSLSSLQALRLSALPTRSRAEGRPS